MCTVRMILDIGKHSLNVSGRLHRRFDDFFMIGWEGHFLLVYVPIGRQFEVWTPTAACKSHIGPKNHTSYVSVHQARPTAEFRQLARWSRGMILA